MKDDASAHAGGDSHSSSASGKPAAWGEPLARFNQHWEALDANLCATVLVAEVLALAAWIALNGLARGFAPGGNSGGLVFRGTVTAVLFGGIAHLLTRKSAKLNAPVVTVFVVVGFIAARGWANVGVQYGSNLLNFLQNASTLMLVGGLRGLVTRFTLWVALLGGALATSRGKHINVDVLIRFLPSRFHAAVAIAGWLAAAVMCFAAVVGFVDYSMITSYRVPATQACTTDPKGVCDTSWSEKWTIVGRESSADFFLLGRQLSLDIKSWPKVVTGAPYDKFFTAAEWNTWMGEADWSAHFPEQSLKGQMMDPKQPNALKVPAVNVPGGGENVQGLLIRELNFVFPFGLFMIGLRFLLRVLLVLSGHVKVNPDAAHEDPDLVKAIESVHAAKGGA